MIHIIDNHLAPRNRPLLQSMFADRKRLFVDLFGWDVPVVDGQYEINQFDNAHTVYLIAADDDGSHAASIRLFPSTQPHMLGTLFPHLCPLGVPVDDGTWESTRLCLPQRHGAERRRELRNALFAAMVFTQEPGGGGSSGGPSLCRGKRPSRTEAFPRARRARRGRRRGGTHTDAPPGARAGARWAAPRVLRV